MKDMDSVGLIGGGQMAEALVRGMLESGLVGKDRLMVADPDASRRQYLQASYGIQTVDDAQTLCKASAVLILAIKPQVMEQVLTAYRPFITSQHQVISIMAGIPIAAMEQQLTSGVQIIRVMPNTPALVLAGATALSCNSQVTDQAKKTALAIFSAVGSCVVVPEKLLDAVTGLSGSGPAYVLTFIEAMVDGGVLVGLPRGVSEQLVLQTVLGTAKLLLESGEPAPTLKGKVTSPGGTSITGLQQLEQDGFRGTLMAAVEAATRRSKELGS